MFPGLRERFFYLLSEIEITDKLDDTVLYPASIRENIRTWDSMLIKYFNDKCAFTARCYSTKRLLLYDIMIAKKMMNKK